MRPRRVVAALAAAVALIVSGCGQSGSASGGGKGKKEVTYLTSFGTFGREAYAYVALEKGYFADAGFDVTIAVGSGTVDDMKMVASGRADYSVGDFTTYAITSARERFPLTVIGAIHQRSLAGIMALEGSGISKPGDLAGKRIAAPGSPTARKVRFRPSAVSASPSATIAAVLWA